MRFSAFLALAAAVFISPSAFAQSTQTFNPNRPAPLSERTSSGGGSSQLLADILAEPSDCVERLTADDKAAERRNPSGLAISLFNAGKFVEARCVALESAADGDLMGKKLYNIFKARHVGERESAYKERVVGLPDPNPGRAHPSLMVETVFGSNQPGEVFILNAPGSESAPPTSVAQTPLQQPAQSAQIARPQMDASDALVLGSLAAIMAAVILGGNDSADDDSTDYQRPPLTRQVCEGWSCRSVPNNWQPPPPPGGGP